MKSWKFDGVDLVVSSGRLKECENYEALEQTLKSRLLTGLGEDEMYPQMGLPWIEYMNAEVLDFDMRGLITQQVSQTGLFSRSIISEIGKEKDKVVVKLDVYTGSSVERVKISYKRGI